MLEKKMLVLALATLANARVMVDVPNGIMFPGSSKSNAQAPTIVLAVGSTNSFRLGITFSGDQGGKNALPSPSLDPDRKMAPFTTVTAGPWAGIKTSFGSLLLNDANGSIHFLSATGNILMQTDGSPKLDATGNGSIITTIINGNGGPGSGRQPCLSNGGFAPPYVWDEGNSLFAFSVAAWEYDPVNIHCYPAQFGSASTESRVQSSENAKNTCAPTKNGSDVSGYKRSKNNANGVLVNQSNVIQGCCDACNTDSDCTAWVATQDGKPDGSGKNCWPMSCVAKTVAHSDRVTGGDTSSTNCGGGPSPPGPAVAKNEWYALGVSTDYYLSPAPSGFDFTKALYELTGAPAVPPRHAMGFMATYWGYTSMEEVEGYMHQFRNGSYPIDSFIMDYDWFGPEPCGAKENGILDCGDFGYKGSFWTDQNFTKEDGTKVFAAQPKDVLDHYHNNLNFRFGGIRKPRSYSHINMSADNGWLLEAKSNVGAGGNNWNYSVGAMRDWYAKGHQHFLTDGIDYWWNDEGETQWFTYLYWNMAQQQQWDAIRPGQRHFTINRAFQPGMQRFPAVTWSGDGQDCSHDMIMQFTLYGQLYTACDMTSPDATVLVRQYQNAVFMPIMRVHQMHGTPRFPFLWGGAEHQVAFRDALNLRYKLLPFMYSLAHQANRYGRPIGHPASFVFPNTRTEQYMVGSVILPADVSTSHQAGGDENVTSVFLPAGEDWFVWNSTETKSGNQTLVQNVSLDEMIVYVRGGAIIPMQEATIQYSDLMGGQLEVHVYGGRDGTFEMFEDDGATFDYKTGNNSSVRLTTWTWDNKAKTLQYEVSGEFEGPNCYSSVQAIYFDSGTSTPQKSQIAKLSKSGSFTFK